MPSSAALRLQIERSLQHRYPAALTPAARTIRDIASTGVLEIDDLLSGGLPVGAISELTGPISSGRTSMALAFLARRTADGSVCAWIDTHDAFDPESAAANGVCLNQFLWVRCRNARATPRTVYSRKHPAENDKPWTRLDQALRATDLLLQAGGFAAIVLDLADVAIEHAHRIPLATWFRFRQAADRTRCTLLVLGRAPYAQSSAAVVLECSPMGAETAGGTVLRGFTYTVQHGRERFSPVTSIARKPPASTWSAHAQWNVRECE
jgi:recombination protein RecA